MEMEIIVSLQFNFQAKYIIVSFLMFISKISVANPTILLIDL